MTSAPLFVELCAGTAALSLRLQARHARPPVSRMGAKTGYADAILAVMGLRPGQRAGHYLWCEPDPGCRLLLEAYRDRELAQAAADIIRGWKDEEPRALWERLRAEGPVKEGGGAREVGRFFVRSSWSYEQGNTATGFVGPGDRRQDTTATATATARVAGIMASASIASDARTVDPREVARSLILGTWAYRKGEPESGFNTGATAYQPATVTNHGQNGRDAGMEAALLERAPSGLSATITADARTIEPLPPLPPGTIAYIDPPYVGTTGYATDLPRSEVVRLARLWSEAGARVYISEAEPLAELDGWHRVEITATRKGQKRTFSKQQAEWLTCSHPPAWTPAMQGDLFGAAK